MKSIIGPNEFCNQPRDDEVNAPDCGIKAVTIIVTSTPMEDNSTSHGVAKLCVDHSARLIDKVVFNSLKIAAKPKIQVVPATALMPKQEVRA